MTGPQKFSLIKDQIFALARFHEAVQPRRVDLLQLQQLLLIAVSDRPLEVRDLVKALHAEKTVSYRALKRLSYPVGADQPALIALDISGHDQRRQQVKLTTYGQERMAVFFELEKS